MPRMTATANNENLTANMLVEPAGQHSMAVDVGKAPTGHAAAAAPHLDDHAHLLWADDHPHLPQEKDDGPVEYKRQLLNPSAERLQHLITQLKFRLDEGLGEAIYQIGHDDDGTARGLPDAELAASLETLRRMAEALKAEIHVLRERQGVEGRCAEVLVRLVSNTRYLDIRVAVAGNVDSGKSTLIGVLTRGALDNGRGLARANVFAHKHEIESGRTSSVSQQIMGFDVHGNAIVQHGPGGRNLSWEEMLESCAKTLTFFDLAGHASSYPAPRHPPPSPETPPPSPPRFPRPRPHPQLSKPPCSPALLPALLPPPPIPLLCSLPIPLLCSPPPSLALALALTLAPASPAEKYLKTTVFGLTGHVPDYVLLAVRPAPPRV
eukprot:tig00020629_g12462.t1